MKLNRTLKNNAYKAYKYLGLVRETTVGENMVRKDREVRFFGDTPIKGFATDRPNGLGWQNADYPKFMKHYNRLYESQEGPKQAWSVQYSSRPEHSWPNYIVYNRHGIAWNALGILESCSCSRPSSKSVAEFFMSRPKDTFENAIIIESSSPNTYGDWISEHITAIARCPDLSYGPILLPRFLYDRKYVREDISILGLNVLPVDDLVMIRKPMVLHKKTINLHWAPEDVLAVRRLYGIDTVTPKKNSAIYLSRQDVLECRGPRNRSYPHEIISKSVESMGGQVIATGGMTFGDFSPLGHSADTVVADHGAAMFNLVQWNTRHVIELVSDSWWHDCFLFLSDACGVKKHTLLRVDGVEERVLRERIHRCIASTS